ncbi:hypothetical protein B0H21DRAFT_736412 [Amylocystis lapponica]|nr:hypothetical protein B0H21DRAFT_736412 [Amylocystis lapponica]
MLVTRVLVVLACDAAVRAARVVVVVVVVGQCLAAAAFRLRLVLGLQLGGLCVAHGDVSIVRRGGRGCCAARASRLDDDFGAGRLHPRSAVCGVSRADIYARGGAAKYIEMYTNQCAATLCSHA